MKITRRSALLLAGVSASAIIASQRSEAFLLRLSGGPPSAPPAPTTLGAGYTLTNAGSAATNVPFRFGYGAARFNSSVGELPNLTSHTLTMQDDLGNNLPVQIDQVATYNGMPGSTDVTGIRHMVISTRLPTLGGASTMRTIEAPTIVGSAYVPGTGLPVSAFTGAHNILIKFDNLFNCLNTQIGSGHFTASVNTAFGVGALWSATGAGYQKIMDGAVCTGYELHAQLTDNTGGAVDPHLMAIIKLVGWQTSPGSGVLGELEIMVMVALPWKNVTTTTPAAYWGDISLYDGATLLKTWSSSQTFSPSNVTAAPAGSAGGGTIVNTNGYQQGQCATFSTTGTLPPGLTAGLPYYLTEDGAIPPSPVGVSLDPDAADDSGAVISLSTGGSGTHTMSVHSTISYRTGVWLTADDSGRPVWAAGTPAYRIYPAPTAAQKNYWKKTGLAPPYPNTVPGSINYGSPFYPGGIGGSVAYRHQDMGYNGENFNAGGDHDGIGLWPCWAIYWWQSQDQPTWDGCYANALAYSHYPNGVTLNQLSGFVPALDNGVYPGGGNHPSLGASTPTDYIMIPLGPSWSVGYSYPSSPPGTNGGIFPCGVAGTLVTSYNTMFSHFPSPAASMLYMLKGDPWLLDVIKFSANAAFQSSPTNAGGPWQRQFPMSGKTYYDVIVCIDQIPRSMAHSWRELLVASVFGADANPEKQYFWNVMQQNIDCFHDMFNYYSDPTQAVVGNIVNSADVYSTFMECYFTGAASWAHNLLRWVSPNISGSGTAYIRDYAVRMLSAVWGGATGLPPYFGACEWYWPILAIDDNGYPDTPCDPCGTFAQMFYGDEFNECSVDNTGLFSRYDYIGYNSLNLSWNNSLIKAFYTGNPYPAISPQIYGGGTVYYITNYTYLGDVGGGFDGATFNISQTMGGSPYVPSGLPASSIGMAVQPLYANAPPLPGSYPNSGVAAQDPGAYTALCLYAFYMAQIASSADPNLAAAITEANAQYAPVWSSDGSGLLWALDSTVVVP